MRPARVSVAAVLQQAGGSVQLPFAIYTRRIGRGQFLDLAASRRIMRAHVDVSSVRVVAIASNVTRSGSVNRMRKMFSLASSFCFLGLAFMDTL
jgi:hypothetical protein